MGALATTAEVSSFSSRSTESSLLQSTELSIDFHPSVISNRFFSFATIKEWIDVKALLNAEMTKHVWIADQKGIGMCNLTSAQCERPSSEGTDERV